MRVIGVTIAGAFSGADDQLFAGLRERNRLIGVVSAQLPKIWQSLFLVLSVQPNKKKWYYAWQHKMYKSPRAFNARTDVVARQLWKLRTRFDVVLQVSGLFAPYRGQLPKPLTLFCDYTTKLAERNYHRWFGLQGHDAEAWYDLETNLYGRCAMIFTASENTKRSLIGDYKVRPDRVRVIGEGVRTIFEYPGKTYRQPNVLMVGIDFERKGGNTLLKAFEKVKKEIPEAKLVVVGPAARHSPPGIVWTGRITDWRKLHQLFGEASVFALPSVCEPFGLAIIEAMSHGLPVIGSRVDAMPEIILEGKTGYLIEPGNSDELADRLIRLLSSPELCVQMGQAGRSRVAERFLWNMVVDRLERGLLEVCAGSDLS